MQKLLYITDQDEYIDHSFIAPLFEIYLKTYFIVDILYFTDFKSDFEQKDTHRFTVPSRYKNVLIEELTCHDVPLPSYDFIMVRNDITLMKHILKHQASYRYKTAFRFSYPKRSAQICCDEANHKSHVFAKIKDKLKTLRDTQVINRCDVFLPTSQSMYESFYPKVTIPIILCPPGINPALLHHNIQHEGEEKRFFYAGTLDKVREFETVLEAFEGLPSHTWKLTISTHDPKYAQQMIRKYNNIEHAITIHNAQTKEELLHLISQSDIGIALLPDIPIYNTTTPVKIIDYYASTIPCLMTTSKHVKNLFTDCEDAWFCEFEVADIQKKLSYLLSLSKEDITKVGDKGQQRLLDIRNYKTIAKDLAAQLQAL